MLNYATCHGWANVFGEKLECKHIKGVIYLNNILLRTKNDMVKRVLVDLN